MLNLTLRNMPETEKEGIGLLWVSAESFSIGIGIGHGKVV